MSRRHAAEARATWHRQRGVGLVEVLVSTVLVSIGLLTLASLQALSLTRGSSAAMRTEAVGQSYDLLDRMRANRAQAIGGQYNLAFTQAPSGSTLASRDLDNWKTALQAALPDGDGQVLVEAQVVTITVRWRDAGVPEQAEPASVSLRTQL